MRQESHAMDSTTFHIIVVQWSGRMEKKIMSGYVIWTRFVDFRFVQSNPITRVVRDNGLQWLLNNAQPPKISQPFKSQDHGGLELETVTQMIN
ncbi:hypothetical protein BDBG_09541 [Blastomyces gilchristii SLH14081]|uniref:Uncharacterized protein n=3 Tax=Blastomyces TaxID=229219 RepID=A0A179V381_BLAGS|nr:uncharacterized protein BDBG_09541 [Blastomyces gilchristii SLH14081]KMW68590.1 hypothetical protein BDDG_12910 [Blastomyces dermatitidis ATCC 18188]OAT14550.1 hypothetical protein BDBG_09541 [Blastomyces gilchristii SLH14081]